MLTTVDVESMATTWAAACSFGSAGNDTVAGCPTATLAASVSLKPAFTCRVSRSIRVTAGWPDDPLLPEAPEEEPPPEEAAPFELPVEPEVDEEVAEAPPPLTDWPTWALTAATVPEAGAFSTVPSSAVCALVRAAWAEAMAAWSFARSPGRGGAAFRALLASVACWEFWAEVRAAWAECSDCWSRATPWVWEVWALVRALWSLPTVWLSAPTFWSSAFTFWLSDATAWESACCWPALPDDWSCCCLAWSCWSWPWSVES